jgi:hypothetical protein
MIFNLSAKCDYSFLKVQMRKTSKQPPLENPALYRHFLRKRLRGYEFGFARVRLPGAYCS